MFRIACLCVCACLTSCDSWASCSLLSLILCLSWLLPPREGSVIMKERTGECRYPHSHPHTAVEAGVTLRRRHTGLCSSSRVILHLVWRTCGCLETHRTESFLRCGEWPVFDPSCRFKSYYWNHFLPFHFTLFVCLLIHSVSLVQLVISAAIPVYISKSVNSTME